MVLRFLNAFWRPRKSSAAAEQRQAALRRRRSAVVFISRSVRLPLQLGLLAAVVPALAWPQGTYTTNFPLTENPISEGGMWINGGTTGVDWTNMQTTPGLAFGTMIIPSANDNDSTALLTGTWGPNQTVTATVHLANGADQREVEIRLRSKLSAHSCTGYEITFAPGYIAIAKWLGALNSFSILLTDSNHYVRQGDVVKATITGTSSTVMTVYINGTQVDTVTDSSSPWTTGAPGMGTYVGNGGDSTSSDLGFSSFMATDGSSTTSPAAPTNLSVAVH